MSDDKIPNHYLIKRSPDFASNGVIVKRHVSGKQYSENSINRKPPCAKLLPGDIIYVSETSYGIYAQGVVVQVDKIIEFTSVVQILNYCTEHKLKDVAYWFNMARKLSQANSVKPSILYYQSYKVNLSLFNKIRPLIGDLQNLAKRQSSFSKIDVNVVNTILNYNFGSSTKLDDRIPGYLRLELYSLFNKKAGLGTWIDVDHFVPKSVGGPGNIAENLVPVGFSLNRYKGNAIPKGVFLVAKEFEDLSKFVGNNFLTSSKDFQNTAEAKDAARKICDVVNSWPINDARQFYLNVLGQHHPDYLEIIRELID